MVQRKMEQIEGAGTAVLIAVPRALGGANNFIISACYIYHANTLFTAVQLSRAQVRGHPSTGFPIMQL